MRRIIAAVLVMLLGLIQSNTSLGQGKKGQKNKSTVTKLETTAQDYLALAKYPGTTATVLAINPVTNTLSIRIEYQVAEATGKPGAQIKVPKIPVKNFKPKNNNRPKNQKNKNQKNKFKNNNRPGKNGNKNNNRNGNNPQQLQREWNEIQRIKNPAQRQQRMAQLMQKVNKLDQQQRLAQMKWMQQMAKQQQQQAAKINQQIIKNANKPGQGNPAVKVTTFAKEFDLSMSPNVRVAKKHLGIEYDEKGNIKQHTPEELKKMQDEKLPGYKATIEEVLAGQSVFVYLGKADPKAAEKKVDISDLIGGNAPGAIPANGPTVQGILILSEPGLGGLVEERKKRKNK